MEKIKNFHKFYDIVWAEKNNKPVYILLGNTEILDNKKIKAKSIDDVRKECHREHVLDQINWKMVE